MKPHTPDNPLKAHKWADGDRLVVENSPTERYVFLDRRMGVAWPSVHHKGYIAVYGLLHEYFRPVVLLCERQGFRDGLDMCEKMFFTAREYHCSHIFADMTDRFSAAMKAIYDVAKKLPSDTPSMYDSSEWATIERATPIRDRLNEQEAIIIPEDTVIDQEERKLQKTSIRSQDGAKPEQVHPAAYALAQCLCSWEIYPHEEQKINQYA